MFEVSPASSPASYSQAALAVMRRASSTPIFASASGCAIPWCAPIGTRHTFRSRA
jgi:hypothetical protein